MKIYLASPYGFADSTRNFLRRLKTRLSEERLTILDPWQLGEPVVKEYLKRAAAAPEDERFQVLHEMNTRLGRMNGEALNEADVVVAALDGSDVDSGTASEIGYAFARGKLIIGYRGDLRQSGENEAAQVNLQVQYWIEASGGRVVRTIAEIVKALNSVKDGA